MKKFLSGCVLVWLMSTCGVRAQVVDTMVFGNATSEGNHSLTTYFPPATDTTKVPWQNTAVPSDPSAGPASEVVSGGMGLSARRLLPRTPNGDVYGGQATFTMAVDPVKQNYFTLKMWASDSYGINRLILNCNGKEIGARHGGNTIAADMLWANGTGWWVNRFFYRTLPLPLTMTQGKTTVTITVRSCGNIFEYAALFTYVPQYQFLMASPSESFYTAYTHTGVLPDVTGEVQGSAPAVQTPRAVETETAQLNTLKSNINSRIASDVTQAPANLSQNEAELLAQIYDAKTNAGASWIVYPSGATDATLGNLIIGSLDNVVTSYAAGSGVEGSDWGGGLAHMGNAIRLAWPLLSSSMSASVSYGGTLGTTTRQAAWAKALRASIDAGRYNRQNIANQAMTNAYNLYLTNRGALLVDSTQALNESEAIRYVKEATGMLPWLGNDVATGGTDGTGGGPVPTRGAAPYGPNWYMCTTKGTTKDGEGFVGSDYGEVGPWMYCLGLISGDTDLQARGIVLTRARNVFRYPSTDERGYLIMMGSDPIGTRNNDLPSHYDYLGSSNTYDFQMASQGAGAIGGDLLGAFQQEVNDGQIYRYMNALDPYLPSRWAAIKAMAQTNQKMPMSVGQPDFAWADEENMVVAAKHGEERLFVNLFWRSQSNINGLAKVFRLAPNMAQLADVFIDDVRFRPTGKTAIAGGIVDGFATPADNPQEGFAGTPLPIAFRSDLSSVPITNRDGGRGTGYTFRNGNWLIGMNADYNANYTMKLPSNFTSATDLVSNTVKTGSVVLAPKTTVVFYLPDTNDPTPAPARSLYLGATGSNGTVTVNWSPVSAASSYNLLRSTTSGSGYTTVATGLIGTSYSDTTVANGTPYYYVLTATNSVGTGDYSPEASATPVAPKTAALPKPWTNVDVGAVVSASTATITSGTFNLTGGVGTFGGANEGFHMIYQPIAGNCVLTAKITVQTGGSSTAALAGIVLRSSLAQNALMGAITRSRNSGVNFQYCGGDGGNIAATSYGSGVALPSWVRLIRADNTLTGYISSDGVTWAKVGSYSYGYSAMPYTMYAGLIVNYGAASGGSTPKATFTNVTFPLGSSTAPTVPTGLAATAVSAASATLAWTEVSGAASYNVKRSSNSNGPFTTVATGVLTPSYSDSGLTNASTYYYVVSAVNSSGESANSSVVSATLVAPPAPLKGLSVSASGTQAVLSWLASSGVTSYTVSRATAYAGPYTVVASGVTGTSYTDTNPSASTLYYYRVVPINGSGSGQGAIISSLGTPLPASWQTQDVGVNVPGGASESSGTYTVYGNGISSNGQPSPFRYAYQAITGDAVITVRLVSQASANNDRAGLMIRDSLDEGSRYIFLSERSIPSGNGFNYEYRQTSNGSLNSGDVAGTVPCWLRIIRSGSTNTLLTSTDGQIWNSIANLGISMNSTICVGLAVCSGDTAALNTAVFDNFSIISSVANGGAATASTNSSQAFYAFDNNNGSKWGDGAYGLGTWWLQYKLASSQVVTQYSITSADDVPGRDPAAWQFQGSNDGSTWTTLDTQTGQVFANRFQTNGYPIANTTAYQYYRLYITANAGGSSYGIQLSEFNFYSAYTSTALVPPPAPSGLSASWSSGQIQLGWQSSYGATSYNVKRATTSGGPYTTIASGLTNPSYGDTSLTSGTTYYYVVSAVNGGGESVNSAENSATPFTAPGSPAQLQAAGGDRQVSLNWTSSNAGASITSGGTASASGGSAPEGPVQAFDGTVFTKWLVGSPTGWLRYQFASGVMPVVNQYAISSGNDVPGRDPTAWQFQGSNDGTTWTTLDTQTGQTFASRGQTNFYVIGNTTAYASYRLNVTANAGEPYLQLSELALFTNAPASYNIRRSTTSGGPYALVGTSATASYTDLGLTNGTPYYYVVSATNLGGESGNSSETTATPFLPAPTGLTANPGNAAINLSWNAVPNATGYLVSRSATGGAPYTLIASPSSNIYLDSGLTNGTTYTYVVATVRSAQQSANSAPASTTPHVNFAAWQQQYFTSAQQSDSSISGPTADANQDGIPNLIAYAFGASPWVNMAQFMPAISTDGGYLTITFTRRKSPADITYTVEVSGDLTTWQSGASFTTQTNVTSINADTEAVTVQDNTPATGHRFIRVKVSP